MVEQSNDYYYYALILKKLDVLTEVNNNYYNALLYNVLMQNSTWVIYCDN